MSTSTTSLNLTQQAWFGAGRKGGGQGAIGSGANLYADFRAGSLVSSASRTNPFRDALREAAASDTGVHDRDRNASSVSERLSSREERPSAIESGDDHAADARGVETDSDGHEKSAEARDGDRDASREPTEATVSVGLVNATGVKPGGATDGTVGVGSGDVPGRGDAATTSNQTPLTSQLQFTKATGTTPGSAAVGGRGGSGDTLRTSPNGYVATVDGSAGDDGVAVKSNLTTASTQRTGVPSATLNVSSTDAAQASTNAATGESAGDGLSPASRGVRAAGAAANEGVLQSKSAGINAQSNANAGRDADAAAQLHAARHDLGDAGRSAREGRDSRGTHADGRRSASGSSSPVNVAGQTFAARIAQQQHGRTQRTGAQIAAASGGSSSGGVSTSSATASTLGPATTAPSTNAVTTPTSTPTPVNASALPTPASGGTAGLAGFVETTAQTSPAMQQQMMRGLSAALRQGGGRVTLRLAPADLGSIRVDVKVNGPVIEASFEASNEGATRLLSREIDSLRTQLEDRGFRVEKLVIRAAEAATETGLGRGIDSRSNETARFEALDDRANDAHEASDTDEQDSPTDHRSRGHARTQDAFTTQTEGIRS